MFELLVTRILQSLHGMECVVLISQPFWRGHPGDENLDWTHELGDSVCWRGLDWRGEGAARDAADARAKRSASADGERAGSGGDHRTKRDGADAGWGASGDGYFQAEECQRASADYLGAHSL